MLLLDSNYCVESASTWGILGYLVMIFKIVVPLMIIILGMIRLGNALVGNKEDNTVNYAIKALIKRFAIGIVIFFSPTVINLFSSMIFNEKDFTSSPNYCVQCLTNVVGIRDDYGNSMCSKRVK